MQRDEFKCRYCGDTKSSLNVHHLGYIGDPWDAPNEKLVTLCEKHHDMAHKFKPIQIVDEGLTDPYDFILKDPILINFSLCYIENHKGIWVIEFRYGTTPDHIIKVCCLLFRFMHPFDCDLRVRIKKDGYYEDIDVYRFLNEITTSITENNG